MMAYQPTRGILDGSKCWVTLSSTAPFTVNACSLCSPEDNCPQSFVISPEMGAKVCLRIGHAPDLMDGFRGSIEQVLRTLNLGSTTTLTVAEGDRSPIKLTLRLDALALPAPFNPTPVSDDEEERQPTLKIVSEEKGENSVATKTDLVESTHQLAWRDSNVRWWLARVLALKTRGTHLFKTAHGVKVESFSIERLNAAFSCYSRALQLIALVGLVARTYVLEGREDEAIETFEGSLTSDATSYLDMDGCFTIENFPWKAGHFMVAIEKLHFSILSNMAICQLKAGSFSAAIKQCDMALQLAPEDGELLMRRHQDNDGGIALNDVEKVLFRRASAYASTSQLDEGLADLERLLRLQPANRAAQKLLSDLKLRVISLQSKLAERLKQAL